MSFVDDSKNPYRSFGLVAEQAPATERADFIRKTYLHLAGAIVGFVALEAVLLKFTTIGDSMIRMLATTPMMWLGVLIAFMVVSWVARSWAESNTSVGMQYAGLTLYVVAWSVLFLPLLLFASDERFGGGPNVIPAAGVITLVLFGGLTAIVFFTGADFSFLRSILFFGGLAAMGFIFSSMILGFSLGILFVWAMVVLACGYILYDTSNVLHHYRIGQHVAASLALFASVALLFWYIIQLVMASRD